MLPSCLSYTEYNVIPTTLYWSTKRLFLFRIVCIRNCTYDKLNIIRIIRRRGQTDN